MQNLRFPMRQHDLCLSFQAVPVSAVWCLWSLLWELKLYVSYRSHQITARNLGQYNFKNYSDSSRKIYLQQKTRSNRNSVPYPESVSKAMQINATFSRNSNTIFHFIVHTKKIKQQLLQFTPPTNIPKQFKSHAGKC